MFLKSILNLTVLLSLSSLSLTSVADDDGTFTYVLNPDATATLTGCVSTCPTELVIPELYDGSRVVAIGERAFNRLPIESVELPTGLVKIGPFAFRGGYLTELTLPDSIEEIGEYAFWQNPLSAVILPSGLKTIGVAVFANNRLTSIELPDTIETISELAFYQNQLQSLVLPNSTKVIGARAFEGNQIARIDLPNGLQRIETYAFWYNAVEELVLPSGLELLGEGAFANNPITKVDLGDLKEIGAYAFYSNRITELELSANVTTIGDYAFSENQIEELIIPVSVMELGRYAFWKNGLRTLEIKSESINLLKEAVFADNLLQTLFLPASIVALGQYALRTNALERLHFLGARPSFGFESLAKNQNLAVITYCSDMSGWPGASIEGITPVADCDGDSVPDNIDAFPEDPSESSDTDLDGVGDNIDNCLVVPNSDQIDGDNDSIGDACEVQTVVADLPDEGLRSCLANVTAQSLEEVKELDCSSRGITSIAGIEQFYRLTKLDLSSNPIENLVPLIELSSLDDLQISSLQSNVALAPISELALKSLVIHNMGLDSLEDWLPKQGTLEFLKMQSNEISDLGPLSSQPGLTMLDIIHNDRIDWATFPSNLNKLIIFRAHNTNLESTTQLPAYLGQTIEVLYIGGHGARMKNLSGLEPFDQLRELWVHYNSDLDWSSLPVMESLERLYAYETGIQSLHQLAILKDGLQYLDVAHHSMENLDGIELFTELTGMNAAYNQISDLSHMIKPISLNLGGNQITDLTPLSIYSDASGLQIQLWDNPFRRIGDLFKGWTDIRISFEKQSSQTTEWLSCQEIDYVKSYLDESVTVEWPTYSDCWDDPDRDYLYELEDAFPMDVAASVDTDEDGKPDDWNEGFGASDSTSTPPLVLDLDDDNDSYVDGADAFPLDPTEWADFDDDGLGNNADTDDDNDGVLDTADAFPLISLGSLSDSDGDGRPNDCDSDCVTLGMTADTDDDNDGVLDTADAFPFDASEFVDTDLDGIGNNADTDDDGDGVLDASDAFPLDATETLDTDSDGTGNNADDDDDGDGVPDTADGYALISLGALLDTDSDGFPDNCGEDCLATGMTADSDDDNDGVEDTSDAFPLNASETADSDNDGVGDNSDAFPDDAAESVDSDSDSVGDNTDNCPSLSNTDQLNADGDAEGDACDSDDDNDGFSDDQEELDGTNPKSRFSCKSGCFSFDVDENLEAQPLTDGLLVIRHLFGFSGESLTSGAVSGEASRGSSEAISGYLTEADSQLDIDGDGESKPLTDGLLLIRYLFGFSGDSLISGAIGDGAERDTAEEVEAYIKERVPVQ